MAVCFFVLCTQVFVYHHPHFGTTAEQLSLYTSVFILYGINTGEGAEASGAVSNSAVFVS